MRLSQLVAAAALALLVAPACAPVRAEAPWGAPDEGYAREEPYEPDDAPDPDEYRQDLGYYGDWHDVPDYGTVWRPTYAVGWRPYVDGYWAWTSYGWTWVSTEPWAWTLHYGRWVTLPAYGWVWVPGTVWGPAWVDWYWGDGYVGWAPLSPFGHLTVINHFVFVHEHDFCSRGVGRHAVHHRDLSDRVRRDWRGRDHRAPRRDRIERVSRDAVISLDDRPRETLAPHRRHDRRLEPTEARRGWRGRDEVPREGRKDERRTVSAPAMNGERERERRRRPAMGGSGRSRAEMRSERESRLRQPRLDRGDDGQLRPHAWDGGREPRESEARRPAADQHGSGGGRAHGGMSMGFAPGAR